MKSFIKKTNQKLLERYPNVWNTRLVWMMLIALVLHLFFYIGGFFAIQLPRILHGNVNSDIRFMLEFGVILFSVIISIIVIVIWIVALFKNNAFKNYYPHSRNKIFLSFIYFLFILLANSSYYLSFSLGYKTFLNAKYSDEVLNDYIEKADIASVFFNFNVSNYDLSNKKYPSPFDTIHIETGSHIDESKPFVQNHRSKYQFFTIKTDTCFNVSSSDSCYELMNDDAINSQYLSENRIVFYNRAAVLDLSKEVDTSLNYYNFSAPFFNEFFTRYEYSNNERYYNSKNPSIVDHELQLQAFLKKVHALLKGNDKAAIEKVLSDFLLIAKEMHIYTNLNVADWMRIVYHPTAFTVDSFIYNGTGYFFDNSLEEMTKGSAYYPGVEIEMNEEEYSYLKQRMTSKYLDANTLRNNIDNIYNLRSFSYLVDGWKIHIWIAFAFASFLFMYRVTGLKSMIFSSLSVGILTVVVALLLLLINLGLRNSSNNSLFNMNFILVIALIVLLVPLTFKRTFSKPIKAIFINITLASVVVTVLFILAIIDEHYQHLASMKDNYEYISIFSQYADYIYWGLLIFGLLFNYFYIQYIIKWKGLPES